MRGNGLGFLLGLLAAGCSPNDKLGVQNFGVKVCPNASVLEGVDVSAYQPNTDWQKVKASGRDFAIVKATEGLNWTNKYFHQDWDGLKAAGMARGPYHFFRANDDGVAQADFFMKFVGALEPGDLPPVIDLETTDGEVAGTISQRARDFLAEVKKLSGRTPLVYTSPSFFDGTLGDPAGFDQYGLWVANWQVNCPNVPGQWKTWPVWQYDDMGNVPGIQGGGVDLDRFNGTLDDLNAYTGATMPAPAPTLGQASGNEAITVVNWPDQHLEVFALSAKGEAMHSHTTGMDDTFSAPAVLDGNASCGMAAGFWGGSWVYPELWSPLANGDAGHLWYANGKWNTFQDFGGMGLGLAHFSTLVGADGRTDVFALGQDGAIWRDFWDLGKKDWSGWHSLGGKLATGAGPILWNDGHGELFAVDAQGVAWHSTTEQGNWTQWSSLGGALASRPSPIRWGDGHVEVFARGRDGRLQHTWWDGKQWAPFAPLGTSTIVGEPSAMENPAGAGAAEGPEVFARDAQGRVVHLWWSQNGFTEWVLLGDQVGASDPFGWVRGDGHGEVFVIDPQGALMHAYRDGNGDWGAWTKIGDGFHACAAPTAPAADGGAPDDGGPAAAPDMATSGDMATAGDGARPPQATNDLAVGGIAPLSPVPRGCGCAVGGAVPRGGSLATLLLGLALVLRSRRRAR